MQFWKYIRNFFFKKSQSDKMGHPNIKKNSKNFVWICNMQFRERSKKDFANNPKVFRLKSEKYQSIFLFLQPCFCQKVLLGSSNAKFGNYAAFFSTKVKVVLVQCPNMKRKAVGFSKKCFSSKERFFGHVEYSSNTSHEIFWPKSLKLKALSPRIMEKFRFFEKKTFFKTCFRAHWKQFWQTLWIIFAKSPKLTK